MKLACVKSNLFVAADTKVNGPETESDFSVTAETKVNSLGTGDNPSETASTSNMGEPMVANKDLCITNDNFEQEDDTFVLANDEEDSENSHGILDALFPKVPNEEDSVSGLEGTRPIRERVKLKIKEAKRTYSGLEQRLQHIESRLDNLDERVGTIVQKPLQPRVWF